MAMTGTLTAGMLITGTLTAGMLMIGSDGWDGGNWVKHQFVYPYLTQNRQNSVNDAVWGQLRMAMAHTAGTPGVVVSGMVATR